MITIGNDWDELLKEEYERSYFKRLMRQIDLNYQNFTTYPQRENLFRPLELTPYASVKVVLLGQEPYHTGDVADGLAFSAKDGMPIPPTLMNVFTELQDDIGCPIPESGSLEKWAKQGVLLLNSVFTVREGVAGSDKNYGWEQYSKRILQLIDQKDEPVAFLFWGNGARYKSALLSNPKHIVIESFHPSPLSANRGFFGSKPFSKANAFLIENGIEPIDWSL